MSRALFSSTSKGNTATGMRRFGILIDQARFYEYPTVVPELIFYSFDKSYPNTLKTPGTGVVVSVGFKSPVAFVTV